MTAAGLALGGFIGFGQADNKCPKFPVLLQICTAFSIPAAVAGGAIKGGALGLLGSTALGKINVDLNGRINPVHGTWALALASTALTLYTPPKAISTDTASTAKPKVKISPKVATLFENPRSFGSLAICSAEGNCAADGTKTSRYGRHVDPGDLKVNGGYCSTSFSRQGKRGKSTLAALEALCKQENEADAKIAYSIFLKYGLKPENHMEAYVNAVDYMNQARNEHGIAFIRDYANNPSKSMGELRTQSSFHKLGGLHFACRNWTSATKRKVGVSNVRSAKEKWRCVHYDQNRRAVAIAKTFDYHGIKK